MSTTPRTSIFNYALKWGLILGLIQIVVYMLTVVMKQYENGFLGIIIFIVYAVAVFFLAKNYRDTQSGGYITYGKAFTLCFLIFVISGVLHMTFSTMYITYINPGITEAIMKQQEQKLIEKGMPDDQLEASMNVVRTFRKPMWMLIFSILFTGIGGSILSLILAAICKKERDGMPDDWAIDNATPQ